MRTKAAAFLAILMLTAMSCSRDNHTQGKYGMIRNTQYSQRQVIMPKEDSLARTKRIGNKDLPSREMKNTRKNEKKNSACNPSLPLRVPVM